MNGAPPSECGGGEEDAGASYVELGQGGQEVMMVGYDGYDGDDDKDVYWRTRGLTLMFLHPGPNYGFELPHVWGTTAGRDLLTGHAAPGTVVRWPKSLTNRDSWPSDPEVFRRELTRPFSPALLLNLYRWDLKPLSSSAQRQKQRRKKQRQGHVSNAVHPRAGLTGLAGGPGSPADAPRGKPPHDDASPAGETLEIHLKYT